MKQNCVIEVQFYEKKEQAVLKKTFLCGIMIKTDFSLRHTF